jgi:hypothetical protein
MWPFAVGGISAEAEPGRVFKSKIFGPRPSGEEVEQLHHRGHAWFADRDELRRRLDNIVDQTSNVSEAVSAKPMPSIVQSPTSKPRSRCAVMSAPRITFSRKMEASL